MQRLSAVLVLAYASGSRVDNTHQAAVTPECNLIGGDLLDGRPGGKLQLAQMLEANDHAFVHVRTMIRRRNNADERAHAAALVKLVTNTRHGTFVRRVYGSVIM